jgi:hypothetical protein
MKVNQILVTKMATSEQINHCLVETYKHVGLVQGYLNGFAKDLIERGEVHDATKFEEPELSGFAEMTPLLKDTKYGTPEYKELLLELGTTIDHHYANNRHHPEHWPNGVEDMTLIDLLEMLADWKAATARNQNGNIRKSIELNGEKFNISAQLRQIMENTVREYFTE